MDLVLLTQQIGFKHNDHTQMQTLDLCMLKWMDSKLNPKMYNWRETQ